MKNQAGQAILIVLLVVAIALGFGLSIIAQSTNDVRISQQEDQATRAFNAAEAGIEEAMKNLNVGSFNFKLEDIAVDYKISESSVIELSFKENETAQIILGEKVNTITIDWIDTAKENENLSCSEAVAASRLTPASLLIEVIDADGQKIRMLGVNACALSDSNGLTDVLHQGEDNYLRQYSFSVNSNENLLRIRPIYNQATIRVRASQELPRQIYQVDSSAQSTTRETKAIQVKRTEPAAPSIFDYVLFSGNNINKQ